MEPIKEFVGDSDGAPQGNDGKMGYAMHHILVVSATDSFLKCMFGRLQNRDRKAASETARGIDRTAGVSTDVSAGARLGAGRAAARNP
jgi:hypothetical protein